MVNSKEFASRIEKILEFYGLSATAFSDAIDFNRSTISHILSGRNKPSLDFVMKVVQEFPEVELYWLLKGKGTFPSSEMTATSSQPETNSETNSSDAATTNAPLSEIANSATTADAPAATSEAIERIVVFYKNGQFKSYHP